MATSSQIHDQLEDLEAPDLLDQMLFDYIVWINTHVWHSPHYAWSRWVRTRDRDA